VTVQLDLTRRHITVANARITPVAALTANKPTPARKYSFLNLLAILEAYQVGFDPIPVGNTAKRLFVRYTYLATSLNLTIPN
jgi:hypothetical protein